VLEDRLLRVSAFAAAGSDWKPLLIQVGNCFVFPTCSIAHHLLETDRCSKTTSGWLT